MQIYNENQLETLTWQLLESFTSEYMMNCQTVYNKYSLSVNNNASENADKMEVDVAELQCDALQACDTTLGGVTTSLHDELRMASDVPVSANFDDSSFMDLETNQPTRCTFTEAPLSLADELKMMDGTLPICNKTNYSVLDDTCDVSILGRAVNAIIPTENEVIKFNNESTTPQDISSLNNDQDSRIVSTQTYQFQSEFKQQGLKIVELAEKNVMLLEALSHRKEVVQTAELTDSGKNNYCKNMTDSGSPSIERTSVTEVQGLRDTLQHLEHCNADLKKRLAEATLTVEEIHCLRWRANELEDSKTSLEGEINALRQQLEAANLTIDIPSVMGRNTQQIQKSEDLVTANELSVCSASDGEDINKLINIYKTTSSEMERKLSAVNELLTSEQKRVEELTARVVSVKILGGTSNFKQDNRLEELLLQASNDKDAMAKRLHESQQDVEASVQEKGFLEVKLSEINSQYKEKVVELDSVSHKLNVLNVDYTAKTALLQSIASKLNCDALSENIIEHLDYLTALRNKFEEEKDSLSELLSAREKLFEEECEKNKLMIHTIQKMEQKHETDSENNESEVLNLKKSKSKRDEAIAGMEEINNRLKCDAASLKLSLDEKDVALASTRESLLEKEAAVTQLETLLEKHQSISDQMRTEIGSAEESLQTQLFRKGEQLQSLSEQLSRVRLEVRDATAAHEELDSQMRTCTTRLLTVFQDDEDTFPGHDVVLMVDALLRRLALQDDSVKDSSLAIQNLKQIIDKKTGQVKDTKDEHDSEINKLMLIIEGKECDHSNAIRDMERTKGECEAQLRHQLQGKSVQLQQLEIASEDVENELKLKEKDIENLLIQLSDNKLKIDHMQSEIHSLKENVETLLTENERERKTLNDVQEKLTTDRKSLKNLSALEEERNDALKTMEDLENRLSVVHSEMEKKDGQLQSAREKYSNMSLQLETVTAQKERRDAECVKWVEKIKNFEDLIEKHEIALSEKQAIITNIQGEHGNCQRIIEDMEIRKFDFEHKIVSLDGKLADMRTEHKRCSDKLEETRKTLKSIEKEHSFCSQKSSNEISAEKKLENCEQKIAALSINISEKDVANNFLSNECDEYERKCSALQNSIAQLKLKYQNENRSLEKKVTETDMSFCQLQTDYEGIQLKWQDLLKTVNCPNKLYEHWSSSVREDILKSLLAAHKEETGGSLLPPSPASGSDAGEVSQLRERLLAREAENKRLDEEMDDIVKHYEGRIKDYVANLNDMPQNILRLEKIDGQQNSEITKLNNKILRLQQSVDLFTGENKEMEKSLMESLDKIHR